MECINYLCAKCGWFPEVDISKLSKEGKILAEKDLLIRVDQHNKKYHKGIGYSSILHNGYRSKLRKTGKYTPNE